MITPFFMHRVVFAVLRFEARATSHLVQIEVSPTHPLLLLKRALPWAAITDVMTRQWRQNGKNVDGGPGLPWG